jgi:hypothetical protein
MTDTPLPEEIEDAIAELVRTAYLLPDGVGLDSLDGLMDNVRRAITTALRQARADALEEAEATIEPFWREPRGGMRAGLPRPPSIR